MPEYFYTPFVSLCEHVGHQVKVVSYTTQDGEVINVSIECQDCNHILLSEDKYPDFDEEKIS